MLYRMATGSQRDPLPQYKAAHLKSRPAGRLFGKKTHDGGCPGAHSGRERHCSPYAQFPVQFAVEGSAALVGPQTAVAEGGMTGTYLRTVGTAGEALLTVSAPQIQSVVLRFTIEKEDAVWN